MVTNSTGLFTFKLKALPGDVNLISVVLPNRLFSGFINLGGNLQEGRGVHADSGQLRKSGLESFPLLTQAVCGLMNLFYLL